MILLVMIVIFGCSNNNDNKNPNNNNNEILDLSLTELVDKLYEKISEEELPMALESFELTSEDIEYFIGTDKIDFTEAIASESQIGSIAHSVVLVRVSGDTNIEDAKTLIKDNVDPRKWICVEAEEVIVDNIGDVIILIMSEKDLANKIHANLK